MDKKAMEQQRQVGKVLEKQEKDVKKILILSLGTGRKEFLSNDGEIIKENDLTREEKQQMVMDGRLKPYDKTIYKKPDDSGIMESAFVAEPLIDLFSPHEVIIIGTSKSAWTSFFSTFGEENEQKKERISRLFALEENGGKDLHTETLNEYAQKIQECYEQGITMWETDGKKVKIHIIVTRYGINRSELLQNYRLISSSVGAVLNQREIKYQVAFDITHSFRSMPIYNLVVLNYLQNVSQVDLEIAHVYYGNLDVKWENEKMAPIVELDELIRVLELSNSVNEFKNTGNAASLLQCIPDTETDLKEALEAFDWATQMNDYDAIMKGLEKLIGLLSKNDITSSDKYADLQEMLLNVIQLKFFETSVETDGTNAGECLLQKLSVMPRAEKQYRLSQWYYRQNRYGQAIATALEALRSYLVSIYLEWKGNEDESNENNRKAAMDRLTNLVHAIQTGRVTLDRDSDKIEQIKKILCTLEECQKEVRELRNVFAHNLEGRHMAEDRMDTVGKYNQKRIHDFFEILNKFVQAMKTDRETVAAIYKAETDRKKSKVRRDKTMRLIIASADEPVDYETYAASSTGKKYQVYALDPEIMKYLDKMKETNLQEAVLFLVKYIQKLELDTDRTHFIFYKLSVSQQINYMQLLKNAGFSNFFDENRLNKALPKLIFHLDKKVYKEISEEWDKKAEGKQEIQKLMEKDIICKCKYGEKEAENE